MWCTPYLNMVEGQIIEHLWWRYFVISLHMWFYIAYNGNPINLVVTYVGKFNYVRTCSCKLLHAGGEREILRTWWYHDEVINHKVEHFKPNTTPKTNILEIFINKYILIMKMFVMWTLGSPNVFNWQHNFHFKNFLFVLTLGKGWGELAIHLVSIFLLGNFFSWLIYMATTCMPNIFTSRFKVVLSYQGLKWWISWLQIGEGDCMYECLVILFLDYVTFDKCLV